MITYTPGDRMTRVTPDLVIATLVIATCLGNLGCTARSDGEPELRARITGTLRIDLLHTGSADTESFSLAKMVLEGPWAGATPGSPDGADYGPYFFEIRDAKSGNVLYSQGYASIFGEWQTIPQALDTSLTFHESLRVPAPDRPVTLTLFKRTPSLDLRQVWQTILDPDAAEVRRTGADRSAWAIFENGTPADKVDILLLGDGYTASEMDKWHRDAGRLTDTLFSYEPFKSRRNDFNVRAIDTPSDVSGIANPSAGLTHETPIGATYDSFEMERYVLTFANERWRDIAGATPYEFVIIVANNEKYGGAGIYNLYATVSADNAFSSYVLVHEFGHHFAGLGDEYYTSDVTYSVEDERPEPWAPNVTADARHPKWGDLIAESTPLPTPWPKIEFELLQAEIQGRRREMRKTGVPEEEVAALFREERERSGALLAGAEYADAVGAFEGANYAASGYYRPEINCIMFTRDVRHFCRVCTQALNRTIDRYTGGGE